MACCALKSLANSTLEDLVYRLHYEDSNSLVGQCSIASCPGRYQSPCTPGLPVQFRKRQYLSLAVPDSIRWMYPGALRGNQKGIKK